MPNKTFICICPSNMNSRSLERFVRGFEKKKMELYRCIQKKMELYPAGAACTWYRPDGSVDIQHVHARVVSEMNSCPAYGGREAYI